MIVKILMQRNAMIKNLKVYKNNDVEDSNKNNYMQSVCLLIFGEYGEKECNLKTSFCNKCCNFHIGVANQVNLLECKEKCNKKLTKK